MNPYRDFMTKLARAGMLPKPTRFQRYSKLTPKSWTTGGQTFDVNGNPVNKAVVHPAHLAEAPRPRFAGPHGVVKEIAWDLLFGR